METQLLEVKDDSPIKLPDYDVLGGLPVVPISDLKRRLKLLLYGRTGAGKSYLAGTAAYVKAMCPILVLNIDGGDDTYAANFPGADISVVTPEPTLKNGILEHKWVSVEAIWESLKLKGPGAYRTIVVDSLSEAWDLYMDYWLDHEYKRNINRDPDIPGEDAGLKTKGAPSDYGRDYNKTRAVIRKMVRGFNDLGSNMIYTAHDNEVKEKTSDIYRNVPSFPGKAVNEIPGFISEVGYLWPEDLGIDPETKMTKIERRVQFQPTRVRPMCKSRNSLPIVMREPTIEKIVSLANLQLTERNK